MTKTAIIAQARFESTRFPGKVMKEICGKTILAHVLERCRSVENVDVVCCAIPDNMTNDVVAKEAEKTGVRIFRGSPSDVLDRYYQAARYLNADIIMRVTCDCPLIDPDICANVISLRRDKNVEFATNNMPVEWPHGLDCEVFTFDLLEQAARNDERLWAREHVTDWMRLNSNVSRASLSGPGGNIIHQRWTVDYPEDAKFVEAILKKISPEVKMPKFDDILKVLKENPKILGINEVHNEAFRDPDALPSHDVVRMNQLGIKL